MAGTMYDIRRTDLRSNVLENPYWITSGEMDHALSDDQISVFFSFPKVGIVGPSYGSKLILLQAFVVEVTEFFAGGNITFEIGQYSIATDDITTAGATSDALTPVYYPTADGDADIITNTGIYVTDSAANWLTAIAAQTWGTNASIIPADATVLCIGGALASDAPITQGKLFLHALISEVPAVG
jgi:hypothetical protein